MPAGADPFGLERLRLLDVGPAGAQRVVDLTLGVLGAVATPTDDAGVSGVLLRVGGGDGADTAAAAAAAAADDLPVLIVPADDGRAAAATATAAFTELTGLAATLGDPAAHRSFRFADAPELWPFRGLTIAEDADRVLAAVAPVRGVEALVSAPHGAVFLRGGTGGRSVYLSLAPLPAPQDVTLLKHEFCAARFVGLLALLVFARAALGDAGWRTPRVGGAFLVDDPNLRVRRYGFLSLADVLAVARREDFHLAVAMIPLDFTKTRPRAAAIVADNPQRLSIVMHGVDHRRLEFEADVGQDVADAAVAQAVARMEIHRERSGVPHARVMTFPHGGCNATWLEALRNTGFDAALASRAIPFAHETGHGNPRYEMHPAEFGPRGFPVINRFKAEGRVEQLLFAAWLGKPLVVYTHHEFFRDGLDGVTSIARFLNRQVGPRWCDIGALVAANHQVRETAAGPALRVFSNRVSVGLDRGLAGVMKPGASVAHERAEVDGEPLALEPVPGGVAAPGLDPRPGSAEIRFGSARRGPPRPLGAVSMVSRGRRVATELRDQSAPVAAGVATVLRRARARARPGARPGQAGR